MNDAYLELQADVKAKRQYVESLEQELFWETQKLVCLEGALKYAEMRFKAGVRSGGVASTVTHEP